MATERAKRPDQFRSQERAAAPIQLTGSCVLCPGNESQTPREVFAVRDSPQADTPGWRVRVVPNKFSAFVPTTTSQRRREDIFVSVDAYGHHEVIIEGPDHDRHLGLMDDSEIRNVLGAYKTRYESLRADSRVKLILLFRNHGRSAGTSLTHPHSQLVATPIIPLHIRQRHAEAIRHYDDTNECLYCEFLEAELGAGKRVVLQSDGFAAVHPFASQVPFETWIIPKLHNPSFGNVSSEELDDLSGVLGKVLRAFNDGMGNPDYNLIVHTAPIEDEHKPYFLWHIEIRPRFTTIAGFELGTGIFINTALPEETAPYFRSLLRIEAK
jgi:UDPglucose--hexose-1-phosphate uridylyltransferase